MAKQGVVRDSRGRDYLAGQIQAAFLRRLAVLVPGTLVSLEKEIQPRFQAAVADQAPDAGQPPMSDEEAEVFARGLEPPSEWSRERLIRFGRVSYRDKDPRFFAWRWKDGPQGTRWGPPDAPLTAAVDGFREALEGWAQALNLAEPWFLDTALLTLIHWEAGHDIGAFAGPLLRHRHTVAFEFSQAGWDPTRVTWRVYEKTIRALLGDELRKYRQVFENAIDAGVEKKVLRRGGRDYRALAHHIDWFIRRQVEGWPWSKISRQRPQAAVASIRDAVETIGKLVRVRLRKGVAGRPRVKQ